VILVTPVTALAERFATITVEKTIGSCSQDK
jgi:hypothetical protein